jgi:hypothetical protein
MEMPKRFQGGGMNRFLGYPNKDIFATLIKKLLAYPC